MTNSLKKSIAAAIAIFCAAIPAYAHKNGEQWLDTDGNLINAHGGGIIYDNGRYWWYGEHRPAKGHSSTVGVTCYSSPDLREWTYEGVALQLTEGDPWGCEPGCIIERPKVIHNPKTGKYVMWFHHELKGKGYAAAQAGTAVSDSPQGPFRMVRSGRVNAGQTPLNLTDTVPAFNLDQEWWTPAWHADIEKGMFTYRDMDGGQMARDMGLFVDNDGKAYHIYSSEDNLTLQIAELDDDYTGHTGRYVRLFPGGHNEAPALFRNGDDYWMIASGCTGWAPNEARMMHAKDIFGPWEMLPNPCQGTDRETTYGGQSTFALAVQGEEGKYIIGFDRWRPESLMDSRYVWLPVTFNASGTPELHWTDEF